jgi:hypothetical protein
LISSARKSPSNLRPEVKISFGVAVLSAGSCRKNLSIEKCRWDYTTAMPYKGPLRILKNETLSADESKVEERFAATVQENLEGIIAEYHARFGNVIDTDRAREFSQDYCASNESKRGFPVPLTIRRKHWWMRSIEGKSKVASTRDRGAFYSRAVALAPGKALR